MRIFSHFLASPDLWIFFAFLERSGHVGFSEFLEKSRPAYFLSYLERYMSRHADVLAFLDRSGHLNFFVFFQRSGPQRLFFEGGGRGPGRDLWIFSYFGEV